MKGPNGSGNYSGRRRTLYSEVKEHSVGTVVRREPRRFPRARDQLRHGHGRKPVPRSEVPEQVKVTEWPHLTLIVRCDQGGLANQTRALWEALHPDTTIVVHVDPPRGEETLFYPGALHVQEKSMSATVLGAVTPEGGIVLSAESFYCDVSRLAGRRRVLIANPELYQPAGETDVFVPTFWEMDRIPGATYLPQIQLAAPQNARRVRVRCETFLHLAAPAMLDRNGTDLFIAALWKMKEPARAIIRDPAKKYVRKNHLVTASGIDVKWETVPVKHWWQCYPLEADALVLPRRYGGLCMPAQEAAACGLPTAMPDLSPQNHWPGPRFPAGGTFQTARMKGGNFAVSYPDAQDLAALMDRMVRGEIDIFEESNAAMSWADELTSPMLVQDWNKFLCR